MRTIAAITGASSHLGQALVRRLVLTGREVRHIDTAPEDGEQPELAGPPVPRVRADLGDRHALTAALTAADVAFHLDARVSTAGEDLLGPADLHGVANLLDACTTSGVRRVVLVSSAALLPSPPAGAEEVVQRAIADGLDVVTVYPTAIVGPGDPGRGHLNRMLLDVWRGLAPASVGGGFDWVDVRDVAAGVDAAGSRATRGSHYLLGGHWASFDDVAARAAEIGDARRQQRPHPGASFATPATPAGDDRFDPIRSRCELGYAARPLDQTLRDTHVWFVARGLVPAAGAAWQLVPA